MNLPYKRFLPVSQPGILYVYNELMDLHPAFSDAEREALIPLIRRECRFAGALLLGFAVRSREVHLLVQLADPADLPSPNECLQRAQAAWNPEVFQAFRTDLESLGPYAPEVQDRMQRLLRPSRIPGEFLRRLFRNLANQIQRGRGNRGSLWLRQTQTLVVDPAPEALFTVMAYIDLSGVREGSVHQAETDPFSSLGQACAHTYNQTCNRTSGKSSGSEDPQRTSYLHLLCPQEPPQNSTHCRTLLQAVALCLGVDRFYVPGKDADLWALFLPLYLLWLSPPCVQPRGPTRQPNRAEIEWLWQNERRPSVSAFREKSFRFMIRGGAIGYPPFLEKLFEAYPDNFSESRESGTRRIPGNFLGLGTLRLCPEPADPK